MTNSNGERHLKYIEKYLIAEIVQKLDDETLVSYEAEHSSGLDGFMSALYNIRLKTKTKTGPKERLLIAKFMKGDVAFRESSKSYIQFANEVFIYSKVLPAYDEVLRAAKVTEQISVENWVAPAFVAKFGNIEGLSASPAERECVLVLENLKPLGYKLGPRLCLNRDHLLRMCKPLGEYHALSFVLGLQNPTLLKRLRSEIMPLPFINHADPNDAKTNLWRLLYRLAFDRFFDFVDRKLEGNTFDRKSEADLKLIEQLRQLREKYFDEPARLLEKLRVSVDDRDEDRRFAAILHGDYNRNNVLFKYEENSEEEGGAGEGADSQEKVADVKMIDFQELRYGSTVIDLSFFMFFNSSQTERADIWLDMLKEYHAHMFGTLSRVLKANKTDAEELKKIEEQLKKYSFEHFNEHFARFAFYGVMICLHFLPWMLCSAEECDRLSQLFETDMHCEEFRKLSIEAGGDEVNFKILEVVRFACSMGYMDHL